jgi:tetratricopeptide (TPR) repeat protein
MRTCARCQHEAEPVDLFCGHCGERLASPALPAELDRTHTNLSAAEVNRRLGLIYLARGKRDDAIGAFRKALALNPGDRGLSRELRALETGLANGTPAETPGASPAGSGPDPARGRAGAEVA